MQSLRQLGGGVIIAIVSVVLVLGGIVLSLAENLPAQATPTQIPPTLPLSFPTPTFTQTSALQTATQTTIGTASPTSSPTATQQFAIPTICTAPSGWIRVLARAGDTVYSLAQRYKTTVESLNAANCLTSSELPAGYGLYVPAVPTVAVVPCSPPPGWVKKHMVQAGDNLYRIALSYGLTYPQLQRGNCMGNSVTIYTGQMLWVPNVPTRTPIPGVTVIPDFPTDTATATQTATATSLPTDTATATQPPTATATATTIPTETATATAFPTQVQSP
ncbi:MAG TPA: LysM peptidoglycan-binding domain-containing protein [Anaerolineales bacterium]|nr:LysM peptidoglycan-binding domain-containing protein [Anaerolineales bacterium]